MDEEKRIVLYVIDTLATGGAERSLLEITSRMKSYRPVVCVLYDRNADLLPEFAKSGIEIVNLKLKSRIWWIEGRRKLKTVIRNVNPDIVHATLFKSEIITRLALLRHGIPNIGSFVNDSYSKNRYRHQSFVRNMKLNVVRVVDAFTAPVVTHFMSISKSIAQTNAKALLVSESRITCIYRGRDATGFNVNHPPAGMSPFVFLTVARLLKRKGYNELFHAAKKIANEGCIFKIRVAGDGADHDELVSTVAALNLSDRVEFLGNRKDVPDLLASSHCFVFPSHYEGQGGSLVEAMLAAKPIIASDIPVFREQVTNDKSGKLFKVFDYNDLAEKMKWMIKHYDEAISLGTEARQTAIQRFDINNTVRLHEELYNSILATGHPTRKLFVL